MPAFPQRQRILWPLSPEYITVQESGQLCRFRAMTLAFPTVGGREAINCKLGSLVRLREENFAPAVPAAVRHKV
jgi:hypothetical protein